MTNNEIAPALSQEMFEIFTLQLAFESKENNGVESHRWTAVAALRQPRDGLAAVASAA